MIKHKFLTLLAALCATTALWAGNVITYTAPEKLPFSVGETVFGPAIISHEFSNGIGTITCDGEVTKIGDWAFWCCTSLTSVTIPNSVTKIGVDAFRLCTALTSVTIPNSVTTIGSGAFYKCVGLTSIVIPYSVKTIGTSAFRNCEALGDIFIPASVDTIKQWAFLDCRLWYDVTCERDYPPESEENCFMTQKCGTLYYPLGSEDVFRWAKSESSKKEWAYAFNYYKVITARTAEVTNVEAYPTESDVEIAWPAVEGAATYTIEIRKGEQLIFVYIFDAKGRFLYVNYMPTSAIKRGDYAKATSTENTAPGWAYTIHGLDFNANYAYSVTAKDASEQVIDTKSGVFSTQGLPTSIDNMGNNFNNSSINPTKSLRNGQVLIRKDGKTYNVLGQEL